MQGSVLLTELDKMDYLSRLQEARMHALPSLERLSTEWEGEELSVEIIDKIADRYLYEIRQFSAQDSLPREQKAKSCTNCWKTAYNDIPTTNGLRSSKTDCCNLLALNLR